MSSFWFFFSIAFPAHSGPWQLIQFRNNFSQTVGLLGREISSSQGFHLNTGQHKHRINAHTNIHALKRIRIHDPSVRASHRPRSYCDRPWICTHLNKFKCFFNLCWRGSAANNCTELHWTKASQSPSEGGEAPELNCRGSVNVLPNQGWRTSQGSLHMSVEWLWNLD
jgi:hypothetical protein